MLRKLVLVGGLVGASWAFDVEAAANEAAPASDDLYTFLPEKVSDGYIKPYSLSTLQEVVDMVQQPSPYDESFQEAEELYGVPADILKLYAVNESRLDPDAQSPTGPKGICQFTKRTAVWAGLKVDAQEDERLDPHKSIMAIGKLMAYYLGRTGGRFFAENGDWGVFEYVHGYNGKKAHQQYSVNVKSAAENLNLPQRIDVNGLAKVKGGSSRPLRLVKASNGMTPIEMAGSQKQDVASSAQSKGKERKGLLTRAFQSVSGAVEGLISWQEAQELERVTRRAADLQQEQAQRKIDSAAKADKDALYMAMVDRLSASKLGDRPLMGPEKQPVASVEEQEAQTGSFPDPLSGGPDGDDDKDVVKEGSKEAFTDQQRSDLAERLMGKKVRIGHVVFDMTQAFADNGTDVSKPVPRDMAMLLGVFEKAYGSDKAAAYLNDTLKAPIDDSETFSVDDGAGVTGHVREHAEYIEHLLNMNKTIFADAPNTKPAAKPGKSAAPSFPAVV